MNTGFIKNDGNEIIVPYEQLGTLVSKLIEPYKDSSEYRKFCFDYKTLSPDYYFLIYKLGYKVINPFQKENTIGYNINNIFIIKSDKKIIKKYLPPTDINLNISHIKFNDLENSIVAPNMISFKVIEETDKTPIEMGHEMIADLIFNDIVIKNPELYSDYIYNYDVGNPYYTVLYLVNKLGYMLVSTYETGFGNIIYNPDLKPLNFELIEKLVNNKFPNVSMIPNYTDNEQQKKVI